MLGPGGVSDHYASKAPPLPGKATAKGTAQTVQRSTVFENWHSVTPQGWHLSKLGCTTCKMPDDMTEAEDSVQLQVIKGLNVFEIDGSASDVYQNISKTFNDVFHAFELEREGCVFVLRCGVVRQQPNIHDQTDFEINNVVQVRNRFGGVAERVRASSLPAMTLKSGYNLIEMNDDQLRAMNMRRLDALSAAAVTPDWLDASMTNIAYHMNIETIDVLLIEGLQTLYDGRPIEEVEKDILAAFKWAEEQVASGCIQYYGVASPTLAPPLPRVYPTPPPDNMLPEKYRKPYAPPPTMNLYRLLALAEQAGGSTNRFKYLSYPCNLTQSQALRTPLDYAPDYTLATLSKKLGMTTLSHNPIEAPDLQDRTQRYHKFPMASDLRQLRHHFFQVMEKVIMKEQEIKPFIDKNPHAPKLEQLFIGSVYVALQLQISNGFHFDRICKYDWLPGLRKSLQKMREGSAKEVKEWANAYDTLVVDMLRFRQQLFQHRHGVVAHEIETAINELSPTLAKCPIFSQKALNFATNGADCAMCGFHQSRYFHEATQLNPLVGVSLPSAEIDALCASKAVSYCDRNPPHPYMMDSFASAGEVSKQKSPSLQNCVAVDAQNPKWPDVSEQLEEGEMKPYSPATPGQRVGTADIANYGLPFHHGEDPLAHQRAEEDRP